MLHFTSNKRRHISPKPIYKYTTNLDINQAYGNVIWNFFISCRAREKYITVPLIQQSQKQPKAYKVVLYEHKGFLTGKGVYIKLCDRVETDKNYHRKPVIRTLTDTLK